MVRGPFLPNFARRVSDGYPPIGNYQLSESPGQIFEMLEGAWNRGTFRNVQSGFWEFAEGSSGLTLMLSKRLWS
jgi:hypothetical protein